MIKTRLFILCVIFFIILSGCKVDQGSSSLLYIYSSSDDSAIELNYQQVEAISELKYIDKIERNMTAYLQQPAYSGLTSQSGEINTNFTIECTDYNLLADIPGVKFSDQIDGTISKNGLIVSELFLTTNNLQVGDQLEVTIGNEKPVDFNFEIIGSYSFEPTAAMIEEANKIAKEYNVAADLSFTDEQSVFYGTSEVMTQISALLIEGDYQHDISYQPRIYIDDIKNIDKLKTLIEQELGIDIEIRIIN